MLKATLSKPQDLTDKQRRKLVSRMCSGKGHYVAQRKWDGLRLLGGRIDGEIRLVAEDTTDYTNRLPHLVDELDKLVEGNGDTILDGELIWREDEHAREDPDRLLEVLDEGGGGCEWIVFDLVEKLGHDMTRRSYSDRIAQARALVQHDEYHGPVEHSIHCVKLHHLAPEDRGIAESIDLVEEKARAGGWRGVVIRDSRADGFWRLQGPVVEPSLVPKAVEAGLAAIAHPQTTFNFMQHASPRRARGNARTRARRARIRKAGASRT